MFVHDVLESSGNLTSESGKINKPSNNSIEADTPWYWHVVLLDFRSRPQWLHSVDSCRTPSTIRSTAKIAIVATSTVERIPQSKVEDHSGHRAS